MSNKKRQQQLIEQLADICSELEWVVALPVDAEKVPGIIMGNEEFVNEVVRAYYGEDYELFTKEQVEDKMKEVPKLPAGKKANDPTFH